jgi:peroxiredoxin Q/BCP
MVVRVLVVFLALVATVAQAWNLKAFRKVAASCSVAAVSALTPLAAVMADAIPVAGSPAPAFSLPSNEGKAISLDDLKGKRTVLYFYPGDFTSGCTIEAQGFEKNIGKIKELGAQVVGVSVDSVDKHLDFGKKYGLEFPLLSDQGGVVSNKYGSLLDLGFIGKFSNRQTYIISPDSKIEYVFTDVEGRVASHADDVVQTLAKLK